MPTTTLSSVGVSNPINLDWRTAGPVTAVVTLGSTTMSTDYTLQFTLDDSQLSSAARTWLGVGFSSGSAAVHFSSADSPAIFGFSEPIAALRISSTAISSSSLTLKTLQAEGW